MCGEANGFFSFPHEGCFNLNLVDNSNSEDD